MAQSTPYSKGAFHDPKTKEDLLDRMMRRDFSGDLADLAENRDLRMERLRPHVIRLTFGASGKTFDLTVHKPRPESGTAPRKKASTAETVAGQEVGGQRRRNRGSARQPKAAAGAARPRTDRSTMAATPSATGGHDGGRWG